MLAKRLGIVIAALAFIVAIAMFYNGGKDGGTGGNLPIVSPAKNGGKSENPPFMPILMYHYFDDEHEPDTISIPPARFREHLLALKDAGYTTISDAELVRFLNGEGTLPEKPLLISIDDGYLNNYEQAYPALRDMDMKATIYAIVKSRGLTPGSSPHFSWDQAREMIASGHLSIQSHSYDSHKQIPDTNFSYLTGKLTLDNGEQETDEAYEKRVREDMELSKRKIEEETGQEVWTFSYPYGKYTENTEKWAKEAGYAMSLSIKNGVYRLGDSPWAMPRITVNGKWTGEQLLAEIKKPVSNTQVQPLMIQLDGQWTNLHTKMRQQNKEVYVSTDEFAKLMKLQPEAVAGGLGSEDTIVELGTAYGKLSVLAKLAGKELSSRKDGGMEVIGLNTPDSGSTGDNGNNG